MADPEQLAILRRGGDEWNAWWPQIRNAAKNRPGSPSPFLASLLRSRGNYSKNMPWVADLRNANLRQAHLKGVDLSEVDLRGADLYHADLHQSNLMRADLRGADLTGTHLPGANLQHANFDHANLMQAELREANLDHAGLRLANIMRANLGNADLTNANLRGADIQEADLRRANLRKADLTGANLTGADLSSALLIQTKLMEANLTGCRIYGIAAWDLTLDEYTQQGNLVITRSSQPTITVDNLEIAQFVYLLLNNQRIRHMVDTITSKVVLILGRFTDKRKAVLDALRDELRRRDYLPVLFDFDKPRNRDLTETIQTLAGMARFVIADLTDTKSLPQELSTIVPNLPSVPVQPLLLAGASEYAMFEHWQRYRSVLPIFHYKTTERLLAALAKRVIGPAERRANKLQPPASARTNIVGNPLRIRRAEGSTGPE